MNTTVENDPNASTTPYFGATGFKTPEQVRAVDELGIPGELARRWGRRFMFGALVNGKTLFGMPTANPRYAAIEAVRDVMAAAPFGVVHFNLSVPPTMDRATRALALGGALDLLMIRCPAAKGVQLNGMRPDPATLARFRAEYPGVELILQVSRVVANFEDGVRLPQEVLGFVSDYGASARHALLDASMGEGRRADPALLASVIRYLEPLVGPRHVGGPAPCLLGVAGGFGPDQATAEAIAALGEAGASAMAAVSFDAESAVHTGDDLDVAKVDGWFGRWQEGASRWA